MTGAHEEGTRLSLIESRCTLSECVVCVERGREEAEGRAAGMFSHKMYNVI